MTTYGNRNMCQELLVTRFPTPLTPAEYDEHPQHFQATSHNAYGQINGLHPLIIQPSTLDNVQSVWTQESQVQSYVSPVQTCFQRPHLVGPMPHELSHYPQSPPEPPITPVSTTGLSLVSAGCGTLAHRSHHQVISNGQPPLMGPYPVEPCPPYPRGDRSIDCGTSLSSPDENRMHHLPLSIERELLRLNSALMEMFQASECHETSWESFVMHHFDDQACVLIETSLPNAQSTTTLERASISPFFSVLHASGVREMYFNFRCTQVCHVAPQGSTVVDCPNACWIMGYEVPHSFKVFLKGNLMMEFINLDGLRIKTLKFNIKDTSEFVNRTVFDSGLDLNVSPQDIRESTLATKGTVLGFSESTWKFLQVHSNEKADLLGIQRHSASPKIPTPVIADTPSHLTPKSFLDFEASNSVDNEVVFSPEEAASLSSTTKRSRNSISTDSTTVRSSKRSKSSSSSMTKKGSYTLLIVEEPIPLSECDISEDVMEICIQEVSNTIKGSPATDSNFVETDLIAMSDI